MIEAVLIAASNIAWSEFLRTVFDLTGQNLARVVDEQKIKLSDYNKFITALDQFRNDSAIKHLYFSFLVLLPNKLLIDLHESTSLEIISIKASQRNHRLAMITGNLHEWRRVLPLIDGELSAIIFQLFSKLGLKNIFKEVKLLR